MRRLPCWLIASCLAAAHTAAAADLPAARLLVKPLLCVLDSDAAACSMTFDIRWRSPLAAEFCLNDSALSTPLRCWPNALSGNFAQQRLVSEPFFYWLGVPGGTQRAAEVKIEVLRLDSADRRRDRRTRHVWDVL
ncbi:MAG TPA: DUF3019 domain-containing protein [Steroidobacteraceae bacterium]|jgi:hypothetical protein|nr:DUF3019 domain-containing protein [Steroidobacteraceae bacterium]